MRSTILTVTTWRQGPFRTRTPILTTLLLLASIVLILPPRAVLVVGFSVAPQAQAQPQPPRHSKTPEEVVQYQLDAFREANVAQAFEYNSPENQEITGPWQSFAASLADPPFDVILGHAESTVLMTISHPNDENNDDDEDEDDKDDEDEEENENNNQKDSRGILGRDRSSDYVCCLVKIVPGTNPLPEGLVEVIEETRKLEGFDEDSEDDDDNEEQDEDEDEDDDDAHEDRINKQKKRPPCILFWWEVSKQYDDEGDYHYLVDSILPDAEDLEMDYMETTLFAIDDGEFDDDTDDDDPSSFFFDLGLY